MTDYARRSMPHDPPAPAQNEGARCCRWSRRRAMRDTFVRKPLYVDGTLDLVSVCRALIGAAAPRTRWCGRRAPGHLHHHRPARRAAARRAPPSCRVRDGGALRAWSSAGRRRGVRGAVADGAPPRAPAAGARRRAQVLGVLGQLDLVSFVANHSHIVAPRSTRPTAWTTARRRARVDQMIALLHGGGIRASSASRGW